MAAPPFETSRSPSLVAWLIVSDASWRAEHPELQSGGITSRVTVTSRMKDDCHHHDDQGRIRSRVADGTWTIEVEMMVSPSLTGCGIESDAPRQLDLKTSPREQSCRHAACSRCTAPAHPWPPPNAHRKRASRQAQARGNQTRARSGQWGRPHWPSHGRIPARGRERGRGRRGLRSGKRNGQRTGVGRSQQSAADSLLVNGSVSSGPERAPTERLVRRAGVWALGDRA